MPNSFNSTYVDKNSNITITQLSSETESKLNLTQLQDYGMVTFLNSGSIGDSYVGHGSCSVNGGQKILDIFIDQNNYYDYKYSYYEKNVKNDFLAFEAQIVYSANEITPIQGRLPGIMIDSTKTNDNVINDWHITSGDTNKLHIQSVGRLCDIFVTGTLSVSDKWTIEIKRTYVSLKVTINISY